MLLDIVFIEQENQILCLEQYSKGKYIFIATTEYLQHKLTKAGIEATWLGSYMSHADIERIEKKAWAIANSWYQNPALISTLTYKGHNLGGLISLYLGYYLQWAVKNYVQVEAALSKLQFSKIICIKPPKSNGESKSFYPNRNELICAKICNLLAHKVIEFEYSAQKDLVRHKTPIIEHVKRALRVICSILYTKIIRTNDLNKLYKPTLFCSAFKHVEGVVHELKKHSSSVYLDETFQITKCIQLMTRNIPYFTYDELRKNIVVKKKEGIQSAHSTLRNGVGDTLRIIHQEKLFFSDSIDLGPLVLDRLLFFFNSYSLELMRMIEAFNSFFMSVNFECVLVDEDTIAFRKCLVTEAKQHAVATIQIPHGVDINNDITSLVPVTADYIAIGGNSIRDYYTSEGIEKSRIVITGIPRYDNLRKSRSAANDSNNLLRFKPGVTLNVLFTLTTIFDEQEIRRTRGEILMAISDIQALKHQFTNLKVTIKTHPLETHHDWIRDAVDACDNSIKIDSGTNVARLIDKSDIILTMPSNIAIETLIMNKPLVVLNYFKHVSSLIPIFCKTTPEYFVENQRQLFQVFKKIEMNDTELLEQYKADRKWLIDEWVGDADGQASERVANLVSKTQPKAMSNT